MLNAERRRGAMAPFVVDIRLMVGNIQPKEYDASLVTLYNAYTLLYYLKQMVKTIENKFAKTRHRGGSSLERLAVVVACR